MAPNLTRTARWLNMPQKGIALPPLLFLTDEMRTPNPISIITKLPRDAGVVFRHYGHAKRITFAKACAELCREQKRFFLIAGHWRLALSLRADGIHLPERMVHLAPQLKHNAPQMILTSAVHNKCGLYKAKRLGIDAAFVSPVFATASHPDARALGPVRLADWVRTTPLPLFALGGIDNKSVQRLRGTGVVGIAAIGALFDKSA